MKKIVPIDVREPGRRNIIRRIRTRAHLARVGDVAGGEPDVLVTAQPRELSILVMPSGRRFP